MPRIKVNTADLPEGPSMVEAGRWRARLMDLDDTESRAGNRMLVPTWRIADGPSKGQTIKSYAVLEPEENAWNFQQLLVAFGHEKGTVDTDEWIGEYARLSIVHEPNQNGVGSRSNVAFVAPDEDDEEEAPKTGRRAVADEDEEEEPPVRRTKRSAPATESAPRRRRAAATEETTTSSRTSNRRKTKVDDDDEDDDDLPF